MWRNVRALLAGALTVLALVVIAPPAGSAETDVEMRVTNKKQTLAKEYGPVLLPNPVSNTIAFPSLADCRSSGYTYTLPIVVALPDDFGYRLDISVSWTGANDLDLFLFLGNGDMISNVGTENHPEMLSLANQPNATYFLCVFNFLGGPTTFTVTTTTAEIAFGAVPTLRPPSTPRPPPSASAEPSTPAPTTSALAVAPATAEPVDTAGPDGERSSRELLGVASSRQAEQPDDGTSTASIVFIVLLALVGAGGIAIVVLRIRRDTASS